MKKALVCIFCISLGQVLAGNPVVSVKSMPPSVVSTVPQAGDTTVDAATREIRATFSKEMTTKRSWSVVQLSKETVPVIDGEVRYLEDKRTCVIPVKLEAGKTYAVWFNKDKFQGFRDAENNPAIPYLLVFQTKAN
jgi:RNA polymerase sigma-70 factor (ECF subfamily)